MMRAMNPGQFDLNLLRVLDALLVTRSVSGAARRVDLSQPAASAALARLRLVLNDPLLVRTGNRMTPTPLAEELRPKIARILGELNDALTETSRFTPALTQRRFRVGANDYTAAVVLVPLTRRLQKLAPKATLEILTIDSPPDLRLATRELDLAIADRYILRGMRGIETLYREDFIGIARADHPRLGRRKVTIEGFLAEQHVLISPRGRTTGIVDEALEARGLVRRVAITVPHYLVVPAIVAQSDFVSTIPRRVVESLGDGRGLRTFRPPIPVSGFDVAMAFDPHSDADPALQWLKGLLREIGSALAGKRS